MKREPDPTLQRSRPRPPAQLAKSAARIVAPAPVPLAYLSYRLRALFIGETAFAMSSQMFTLLPALLGHHLPVTSTVSRSAAAVPRRPSRSAPFSPVAPQPSETISTLVPIG